VFGAWTAWHLLKLGRKVLLLDAWGPAHARASSGGESRMTRTVYGRDEIYTRFAWESLDEWRWLSGRSGLPIFHPTGVVFFFGRREPYATQAIEVHQRMGIPLQVLERAELAKRFPQVAWEGVEFGLHEPDRGVLMARRAVQTLLQEFVAAGGEYRQAAIVPPQPDASFDSLRTTNGESLSAARFVFACGPWLPKVFPEILGQRIFPTRQEVFFFAPPAGDTRFSPAHLPGWADFNDGDIFYGMPDLESRGFKVAHDQHGPPIDPDVGDRTPSAQAIADVREYMRRRFPAVADRPLVEARVREQLERGFPDRSAPAVRECGAGGRGIRAWVQAWAGGGTLRGSVGERHEQERRAAVQSAEQSCTAATRRALSVSASVILDAAGCKVIISVGPPRKLTTI
jgi:glycine/D-amino acid oxidase-like deaminating enzyme